MLESKIGQKKLIAGIGSALVDILLKESDDFVAQSGSQKGGMTLVEREIIDSLLSKSANTPETVAGGSACNTIVGAGTLGGPARFVGKRGRDDLGEQFEKQLRACNVEPILLQSDTSTGRVLSVITPDAQRTMFTCLGASSEATPEEIHDEHFSDAAIVHVEGYLLFNEPLITRALSAAKNAGALVSLDLASFTVVEASRNILDNLVEEFVDILIANEDEARAFTGLDDESASLEALSRKAEIAVLKVGKRGSSISTGGTVTRIGILGDGSAVDTTGAGDLWAAGFLYGLVNGYPIEKCGELGAACGYEVCQ
ncbi:MAG: adenosine kinase, partial [Chitinivibrionales bacterium]|nr:adenosine kinase [Chitinivibrionales bacterium]